MRSSSVIFRVLQSAAATLALLAVMPVGGCVAGRDGSARFMLFDNATPAQVARDAFNIYDADLRRRSITQLSTSSFGGEEPYVRTYRLLSDDVDPTVRAACIKALGMHGTAADSPLIARFLADESPIVRWEAAVALQKIHDPAAARPLMDRLHADPDLDVRAAAATALGQYAQPAVFNSLVAGLNDRDFAVAANSRESLRLLTGEDLGDDPAPWLAWSRDKGADLFERQQPYMWYPFTRSPTLMSRLLFWQPAPDTSPRVPVGLKADTGGAGETSPPSDL